AREATRAREGATPADVELADQGLRALHDPVGKGPAPPRVRRLRVVVQREVLRDRELQHEAAPLPVLGNVAESRIECGPRARVRELATADGHGPALDPA